MKTIYRLLGLRGGTVVAAAALVVSGCGGGDGGDVVSQSLSCDSSITQNFKPDAQTSVVAVKEFKKGDPLPNKTVEQYAGFTFTTAQADVCMVKLLVGPGNPGPASAPSTTPGIGIEVWLPAKSAWNGRVHAVGGAGWAGSEELDTSKISSVTTSADFRSAQLIAAQEGAVASSTDTGQQGFAKNLGGSFAMNPDGTINTTLWVDFASRAIHEQVVKSKALAQAYYGSAPKFTYWDGGSTGGRQALKQAQAYPADFDGILASHPAINWTRFITYELYPQIVIQRDLGGSYMSAAQLNLASLAAISACDLVGGKHLGFVLDPSQCRYDPTKDASVLCSGTAGNAGALGTNSTSACVNLAQATAINKIWYGMTSDGSVPDPAIDNGFGALTGVHKWYGLTRGTSLLFLATSTVFDIGPHMVALELQKSSIATPSFINATGNGADGWKSLSYQQFANAYDIGVALQPQFGFINTDNPDLSAFKARGGKLIHVVGGSDPLIPPQGSELYYDRVVSQMGGLSQVQGFYQMYFVAGMGHGSFNQTANPTASMPMPALLSGDMYKLLTDWAEKGTPPANVVISSAAGAATPMTLPLCAYPSKPTYVSGDALQAASYKCQ